MRISRRLLVVAAFIGLFWAAWVFTHSNDGELVVDLLGVETRPVPIWLALLTAFGAGMLSIGALLSWQLAKKGLVARRYRKTVIGLESEIHQLRNLPLASEEIHRPPTETDSGGDERLDRSA